MTDEERERPAYGRRAALAVTLCAMVLGAGLTAWWTATDRARITGDEPHYLIIAASLLRDRDLDVRNNYEEDARTREIYGPVRRHAWRSGDGLRSFHAPGLGLLLALPLGIGGVIGSRVVLALVVAAVLAWTGWIWARDRLSPSDAVLATAGIVLSVPVVAGGGYLYPDLLGGALLAALAVRLLSAPLRSATEWACLLAAVGLACALHPKNVAAAGLLAALALWRSWREHAARGSTLGNAARQHPRLATIALAVAATGAALVATWLLADFADIFVRRLRTELGASPDKALRVFLGLHLDQAQGMFFQQPLLLPGLAGLGWMIRRRHPFTLPWLALYLSLLVPTALHTYSEYGGAGPSGRFGWTAMWLWLVPLGFWMDAERETIVPYVRSTLVCGLAYQAALAVRWLPDPSVFVSRTYELVWNRNSLFPIPLRYSLPHFYDTSLDYLPNIVWTLAALLLVVTGVLWTSAAARGRLRGVWAAGVAVAALLLPVEPTADRVSAADERREEVLDRSLRSIVARRFEAERLWPMSTAAATTRRDPAASAGAVRAAARSTMEGGVVVFGPYLELGPGRYRATAALRLDSPADGRVARFEVVRRRSRIAAVDVPASHLRDDGEWALAAITFESAEVLEEVEFRIVATPGVDLLIDYIDLTPILPHPAAPVPTVVTELPPAP
jgi:hypothetical protein